ncbi:MAG: hypothetical protein LW817_07940, partial [Candidatus Caenarcaniphilales bacterium]|nr:hypothetical protein [Candidatus Caenarcaniphilales bacterium]
TSSDGSTEIAREVVSLSETANTGELWFKAPSLSSAANTEFYIYYGNNTATAPLANSTFGSQAVWSNGFVAVYHMNAVTNGTASVLDSTSFARHGTPSGNMSTTTVGRMGTSITFDGTNDSVNIGSAISSVFNGNSFSVSAWDRRQAINAAHFLFGRDTGGSNQLLSIGYRSSNTYTFAFWANDLTTASAYTTTNTWRYWHGTYNTSTNSRRLYQDGILNVSDTSPTDLSGTGNYFLGRGSVIFFNGQLDEIKISNKERNRNWIATEYNNQNAPLSFYTLSSEQGSLAEFPQRLTVTIKASQINGSVTQMPVFINLDHMPAHFFTNVKGSGADIRMTTGDGVSQVPVEIVSLDKASTNGEIWFRAPSLTSASDTVFYLYYGLNGATLPAANSVFGSQNVWSNGFVAVYHMNAVTNGTASVLDSTSFANHGTPFGGMSAGSDLVAGRTGSAIDFDGSNDMIDINNDTELRIGIGTISSWIKTADAGSGFRGIVTKQNAYSSFLNTNVLILFDWGGGGTRSSSQNLANNTWRHNAISFQSGIGSGTNFYTDGVLSATSSMTVLNQTSKIGIGAGSGAPGIQHLSGNIDEVRVANKVRNCNWVATEYNNQNTPASFYTIDLNENLNLWSTRNKITIPSTVVNGSVSELPVYVNLRHLPASFWTSVKTSGSDIRMTNAAGTPLAIELVSIDKTSKTGELWFKAPTLTSAAHNHFYIYSGNNGGSFASPISQYGSQAVWSNGFVAVYHMNALSNGTASVLDSTSFVNHGTPFGGMTGSNIVTGRTGNTINFDGSNDMININNDAELQLTTGTVSSWIKTPNAGANYRGIATKQWAYGHFLNSNTYIVFDWTANTDRSSGQNLADNNWHHSVFSFQSGVASGTNIYSDAVLRASSQITVINQAEAFAIAAGGQAPGIQFFAGNIDEVRVANKIRNRNWITTEYNNQSFPERFYMINNSSLMNATFFGRMF